MISVIVWLALSFAIGYFAQERGRSAIGWGLAAAFLARFCVSLYYCF